MRIPMMVDVNLSFCCGYNTSDIVVLHIEWERARERAHRWSEEVALLSKEMQRTVEFFLWQERWWKALMELRIGLEAGLKEGLHAYTAHQAAMY